ncbi:hypothetical protein VIBHAR_04857 [Vibrio campbellii ATCC BAA-1116]|uniref:Uncharacterized protein n=1 Tax=Vibrio campbellii (strain ATCC BAA-1116) TaxID=2902295 RepID=A7N5M9_VIBC1|nr:hypothetical protein VIBHAR_04857 [Vibrio campbellii ATCC BAA-1116]
MRLINHQTYEFIYTPSHHVSQTQKYAPSTRTELRPNKSKM